MKRLLVLSSLALLACPPPHPQTDGGAGVAPTITALAPTKGPVTGNTQVNLVGTNFDAQATVKFGDAAGLQVVVANSTRLAVVTPAVTTAGIVDVTVTNPDGKSGTLTQAFEFTPGAPRVIEQSVLENPAAAEDTSGNATVTVAVLAQVQVPGVTQGVGQGSGVRAQVGFATTLSTPPVSGDFTWLDAAYLGDADGPTTGDLMRDAYHGDVVVPGAGPGETKLYFLAARFSVDSGTTWTLADRDGSANGVQGGQLSQLTVTRSSVDWCKLGGQAAGAPPTVALRGPAAGPVVYGQVYKATVTDQAGVGAGIDGELGYGVAGTDPATWTWTAATYNVDTGAGANDEYMATLPNPGAGSFLFAYRFRHQGGAWAYCDADGLATGGFTENQCGQLTATPFGVDRCVLQFPSSLTVQTGQPTPLVYGRVFAEGITDGGAPSVGIQGQLGYGATTVLPTDPSWVWSAASYNLKAAGGEEYQGSVTAPALGTWAYAYRFRYDGGSWVDCDLDSSDNGFSLAQAGVLTSTTAVIGACRLASVSAFSIASGDAVTATVRVLVPGVSADAGATAGLRVQLGVGPQGDNASTSSLWGWTNAAFAQDIAATGEDEFSATFNPAYSGNRDVSGRASLDNGATWTYCDLNGSDDGGYQVAQQYYVAVGVNGTWCNTQYPLTVTQAALDAGTLAYGRVYEAGLTPDGGAPIIAQLGVGQQVEDPGLAWAWQAATFNVVSGNNNEYGARLPWPLASGTMYAFRFTVDGGSWCYGDLDGASNGFAGDVSGSPNLGLIVP